MLVTNKKAPLPFEHGRYRSSAGCSCAMLPLPLAHAPAAAAPPRSALGDDIVLCVSETSTPNGAVRSGANPSAGGALLDTGCGRELLARGATWGGGGSSLASARLTNTCSVMSAR
jgi:hypothetical protein